MRKFIISDIHGFGNVYYSMMKYLDNISKNEEIELYINGDLIDYGYESSEILLDIISRIKENKFKITYLAGDHELLMHGFSKEHQKEPINYFNDWYNAGGWITDTYLYENINNNEIDEVFHFISNLKVYQKFSEKLNKKNIVLVHSACPKSVRNNCNVLVKKDNNMVYRALCTRELDIFSPYRCSPGNDKYFTIIGHTPNINPYGYIYFQNGNYLNIDGGCEEYVTGNFEYNHFPLVEVCEDYLKILTFNSSNEIIYGNYFDGYKSISYSDNELNEARKYLDSSVKIKKLTINEDGMCGYWD